MGLGQLHHRISYRNIPIISADGAEMSLIKISPVTCYKCNKPVDRLNVTHDPYRDVYRVTVTCHGEQDTTDLPKYMLYDATLIDGGQAFRADRLDKAIS